MIKVKISNTWFIASLYCISLLSCGQQKKEIAQIEKVQTAEAVEILKKPNIIWLMAEDISTDIECYGMQAVKTPNLNRMAENGVRFENAFVTNPICSPSRSSMMLGVHQVKSNTHHHRSNRETPLDPQFTPFTQLLREAGYTTILGNHSVMNKGRKIDVNFKYENLGEWDGKTKFGLFDKYDTFEKQDEPFFAQIQLVATHRGDWWDEVRAKSKHPVNPNDVVLPEFMADHPTIRLDWAKYLDQMEYIDAEIGVIFKELEDKGMADNTMVIFIGDNGRCNIKGKGYLHDPGLRIPLIVYYPEQLKKGEIRKDVVSATDITATILDAAGVEIPDFMTGKPMFDPDFKRDYVYAARDLWDEVEEKSRAVTSGEWKYIRNDMPKVPFDAHQAYLEFYRPAVHVMRTLKKQGKLTKTQEFFFKDTKPKEELYDLKNDPLETKNLVADPKYAEIVKELREKTLTLDKEMEPVSTTYVPIASKAVAILEYVKKEKPALYQEMQNGVEIGFKKMADDYKKHLKESQKQQ
ncbi:sulfatase [Aquimarina sp. ERC-38]|uniref:sulfatase family protein n=1 Tax=Aquimarina sp. ERC-38 TaxID=2949996 RepID=UPI002246D703|nr:sulfatase [Aquimarina sp. ERC-38]UZO82219.1 sulfatase [Aquimarina sp. ERC-38]